MTDATDTTEVTETPRADERGFSAPYISHLTYSRTLDRLNEVAPPRIDRSWLENMSGSQQTQMIQALRGFGLLGPDGEVLPRLVRLADPAQRNDEMKALLEEFYGPLIELGRKKATQGQMEEWFKQFGYSRRTMGKAVAFYLKAAEEAGVPKSPFFRAVKDVRGPSGQRAKKPPQAGRFAGGGGGGGRSSPPPPPASNANHTTVELASGGKVTVAVEIDLFTASDEDRQFVLDLVTKVRDYGKDRPLLPAPTKDDQGGGV